MTNQFEVNTDPTSGATRTPQSVGNNVKQGVRLLGVTVVALLIAMLTITPTASAKPTPKADVCHLVKVDAGNALNARSAARLGRNPQTGATIKSVKAKQLATHIAHGDGLPGGPVPGVAGYEYDETCAVRAIDSDGDGVSDLLDICPGFDDLVDADSDGIPDGCDLTPNGDPPDQCGGFANIQVPSDVALYDDCEVLDAVYVHISGAVTDVTLPLLTTVNTYVYFHQNSGLENVSMPQLTNVGDYVYFHQNQAVQSVDLRSLETVGQYLYFHENTQLSMLQLNSLSAVNDYVYFVGNTSLCPPGLDWTAITSGSITIAGNNSPC